VLGNIILPFDAINSKNRFVDRLHLRYLYVGISDDSHQESGEIDVRWRFQLRFQLPLAGLQSGQTICRHEKLVDTTMTYFRPQ